MKYLLLTLLVTAAVTSASLGDEWETYLNSNRVRSIWTDQTYVYWGSTGGVVIYDPESGAGTKIVKSVDGLRSIVITAILKDADNRLWMGTSDVGACVLLDDGSWEFHGTQHLDLPKDEVTGIATWAERTVVGTAAGVSLFEGGDFKGLFVGADWGYSECNSVLSVGVNDNEMLVGTECGLFTYSFSARVWTPLLYGPAIQGIDYDEKALFWVVTDDSIYAYDGSGLELISKQFIRAYDLRGVTASDSVVWVACSGGPARYDFANKWWDRNVEGLPQNLRDTRPITLAGDGEVWLGTESGIAVLRDTSWVILTAEGPAGSYVEDLEVDATGRVWCMTGYRWPGGLDVNIGILRFDGSRWEHLTNTSSPPDSIPANAAYSVDSNPVDGSVWVGFWSAPSGDLLRYDVYTGEWTSHRHMLKSKVTSDIYIDKEGTVVFAEYWYEAGFGVLCSEDNVVHYSMIEDPRCINTACVTAIGPGPGGSYFFGDFCEGEINMIDPGEDCLDKSDDQCMAWTEGDGFKKGVAYDIEMDSYGVVWLATSGGLSCYDGRWHTVNSTIGVVWDVEIDGAGTKWVGCEQGLYALKGYGTAWEDFSDGLEHYDASNSPLAAADVKALASDADGALWIGTAGGGIYRFYPPGGGARKHTWVDAFPNPYKAWEDESDTGIRFKGFLPGSRIRIYTLTGELVAELDAQSVWSKATMDEQETASGVYIYHAYAEDGSEFVGRLAIIR